MKTSLIVVGALVGFVAIVQFHSQLLPSRASTVNEEADYEALYQSLQQEQTQLRQELTILREEEEQKNALLSQNLQDELEAAQSLAGFTEKEGSGVVLRLSAKNTDKVNTAAMASYLRDTVNLLMSIQAEAVSVNGYRVVFKTPIISVGDSILLKNLHITAPFEIQVIGNSDFIVSALEVKTGFAGVRKAVADGNISMELQQADVLKVPAYIY